MNEVQSDREAHIRYFWKLMQWLKEAKMTGDPWEIWQALDEIDTFAVCAASSAARARAAREVARHNFDRTRRNPA